MLLLPAKIHQCNIHLLRYANSDFVKFVSFCDQESLTGAPTLNIDMARSGQLHHHSHV
jgi:hypothetical protein